MSHQICLSVTWLLQAWGGSVSSSKPLCYFSYKKPAISHSSALQTREPFPSPRFVLSCWHLTVQLHYCCYMRPSTTSHWEALLWPRSWYRTLQLLTWEPCCTPAHSEGLGRLTAMRRIHRIHTCVLNSYLWTPAGDLCCGCGSGSGGVCVGRGTGSETSAAHGKPTSSVAASYPETVIWRGHTLPQIQEKGQCIGSAHLSPSLRHSQVTNIQSTSTRAPSPIPANTEGRSAPGWAPPSWASCYQQNANS